MFAAPIATMHAAAGSRRTRIPGVAGHFSARDLARMLSTADMHALYALIGQGNTAAAAELVRERALAYQASAPTPAVAPAPTTLTTRPGSRRTSRDTRIV